MPNIFSDDFLMVWGEYPLKREKIYAFKCYKSALSDGATFDEILTGIKKYKKWLKEKDFETWRPEAKHLSTYLNKGCWGDDYDIPMPEIVSAEESRIRARIDGFYKTGYWKNEWGEKPKLRLVG